MGNNVMHYVVTITTTNSNHPSQRTEHLGTQYFVVHDANGIPVQTVERRISQRIPGQGQFSGGIQSSQDQL